MSQLSPPSEQKAGMPVLVVTGLSGAGKSTVLNVLEDLHFLTMDGLPIALVPQVADVFRQNGADRYRGLALGVDLRDERPGEDLDSALRHLHSGGAVMLLFLEADEPVLLRRYAETRRPHPLEAENMGLEQALHVERQRMAHARDRADLLINTSDYSIHDLRRLVQKRWSSMKNGLSAMRLNLISFGFKYGAPADADMLFDLRFLPNPYFDQNLRPLSGLDAPVADYVMEHQGKEFLERLLDFFRFLLPQFEAEGRYRLTVGIGCTGGKHRSVAIAEALGTALRKIDYSVSMEHRHLGLG